MNVADDETFNPNLAIRYFQSVVKYKIFIKETLNTDIYKLFQYINNVSLQIQKNFNLGILSQEKYSKLMNNVDYLIKDCKTLPDKITFRTFLTNSSIEIRKRIDLYILALQKLVKQTGAQTCTQIFDTLLEHNWATHLNTEYFKLINFYDKFFSPICCNLIENLETMSSLIKDNITILPFVKKYYESFEPTEEDISYIEKIYGADVYFQFGERLLFVRGVFHEDNINSKEIELTFSDKYKNLMRRIEYLTVPEIFKVNYIEQLSIRNFLSLSILEITNLLKNDHNLFNKYKKMDIDDLMHKFNNSSKTLQRNLLMLFTIADEKLYLSTKPSKQQFVANIIYESIQSSSPLYAESLFKSLHWTVQKKFKLNESLVFLAKQQTLNLHFDNVSYESKLALLKDRVPDNILKRALEKYKESMGSKESSVKAQQYLDAFLKIPFSNYKKEPMISFLEDFKITLATSIDKSVKRIKTSYLLSTETRTALIKSLNLYNSTTVNTESTITNYLTEAKSCVMNLDSIEIPPEPPTPTSTSSQVTHESEEFNDSDNSEDSEDSDDDTASSTSPRSKSSMDTQSVIDSPLPTSTPDASYDQSDKNEYKRVTEELRTIFKDWNAYREDRVDYIKEVRSTLDSAVHGHDDAKR